MAYYTMPLNEPREKSVSSHLDGCNFKPTVPSCDITLDDWKVLAQIGRVVTDSARATSGDSKSRGEYTWETFKRNIAHIIRTLRLDTWPPLKRDLSSSIRVDHLEGGLTNSLYTVSLSHDFFMQGNTHGRDVPPAPKDHEMELVLRIYGSQVQQLLDREAELGILSRLSHVGLGPCILGTFANGRLEKFIDGHPLTSDDIRVPDISNHIAKRICELHEKVGLLPQERESGLSVWRTWDRCIGACDRVMDWLGTSYRKRSGTTFLGLDGRELEFICGVEWTAFKDSVDTYRKWLEKHCGGIERMKEGLVLAHNDTQPANFLRAGRHDEKHAVSNASRGGNITLIDFEFAGANAPGFELANHFTEWCYDYNKPVNPELMDPSLHPTPQERARFIHSYIQHRRRMRSVTLQSSPEATEESRKILEEEGDKEVEKLAEETRIWRAATSVHWILLGIYQAGNLQLSINSEGKTLTREAGENEVKEHPDEPNLMGGGQEGKFNYLACAQDRALLYWADMIQLGLVKPETLPEMLSEKVTRYIIE